MLSTIGRNFVLTIMWYGIIFAFESSEESMSQTVRDIHESCVEESGVNEEIFNMTCTEDSCPDDPEYKCYLKCAITKIPIMDENGEIDVEYFVSVIPDEFIEMAEPVIRGCGTIKGTDDCDTAYQTVMCWFAKGPFMMESITSSYEAML